MWGAVILEEAKHLMYNFLNSQMKPKYDNNIKLSFTNTDSLLYEIYCDDFYKDLSEMKHHFDFPIIIKHIHCMMKPIKRHQVFLKME